MVCSIRRGQGPECRRCCGLGTASRKTKAVERVSGEVDSEWTLCVHDDYYSVSVSAATAPTSVELLHAREWS